MTDVRKSQSGGRELFALRDFAVGEIILDERPIVRLFPSSPEAEAALVQRLAHGNASKASASVAAAATGQSLTQSSVLDLVKPPSDVSKECHSKFRAMVRVGLSFIVADDSTPQRSEETWNRLSKLYHPPIDAASDNEDADTSHLILQDEKDLVLLSRQATKYIQQHLEPTERDAHFWDRTQKTMLIWACNSFEGGRIYDRISRINHSCDPNAVVVSSSLVPHPNRSGRGGDDDDDSNNSQKVVAAAPIAKGEAITISYLGLLLYADKVTRKSRLREDKYFDCQCSRCNDSIDQAGRVPCPTCHPRLPQQVLDEDVQYDDDQTVHYCSIHQGCINCNSSINDDKLRSIIKSVSSKVAMYLESYKKGNGNLTKKEGSNSSSAAQKRSGQKDKDNHLDDDNDDDQILEEYVSLASSTMGDKHWTTNLLLLLHVDQRLSSISQAMLTTQEPPEMEDIAEIIDSVERICRFINGIGLKLHMGHVLSDVIIGVSRMLVSLGDEKSQKYGAEWVNRIDGEYMKHFESEGRQKVVEVLKNAWKKHSNNKSDDNSNSKKRARKG